MADQALGGQAGDPTYKCLPLGMPRLMGIYTGGGMEVVILPDTTYILIDYIHDNCRIYTDGRDFPANMARMIRSSTAIRAADPYGSAYWGRPAAHKRAGKVVGAAESDP